MATFSPSMEEERLLTAYNRKVTELVHANQVRHNLPTKDREYFFIRFPCGKEEISIKCPSDEVCYH
jgi:hypothetical protein